MCAKYVATSVYTSSWVSTAEKDQTVAGGSARGDTMSSWMEEDEAEDAAKEDEVELANGVPISGTGRLKA